MTWRRASWIAAGLSVVAGARGAWLLSRPTAPASDLPGFALVALCALMGYLALVLRSGLRAWTWWLPAAWIGCAIATLTLAYKDTLIAEWHAFGAPTVLWHATLHVLIAPIELFFGFVVGFIEPDAWMYVVVSIGISLLASELIRRRLWPRSRETGTASPRRV